MCIVIYTKANDFWYNSISKCKFLPNFKTTFYARNRLVNVHMDL